jgi:ABC-type uncharacterized transport system ATPase subunit
MNEATASPPALMMRKITRRFGELTANDGISLTLERGEVVALLGENGAGKTTLMSILFGHDVADEGEILVDGQPLPPGSPDSALRAGIGMVHQHFTLADNLTVLDNVMLGTEPLFALRSKRAAARRKLIDLATTFGLRVHPEVPVGALSIGERQRVEILKALYRDARLLILDEPTAVLTPQESERLFEVLRRLVEDGLGLLFISHKLDEVLRVSDRIVVLRSGRVVLEGPTTGFDRATLGEAMVGRAVPEAKRRPAPPGEPLLELRDVTVGQDGRHILDEAALTVHRHEILGIAGVAGNGQTPLAELVSGLAVPSHGEIRFQGEPVGRIDPRGAVRRGVARVPEDRHAVGVIGDMSVAENVVSERYREPMFSRLGWLRRGTIAATARAVIDSFGVRCPGADAPARVLSGGNMQKLILGRALTATPNLILAHQPTRGLDVGAIAEVHRLLLDARERGAGVLLISEDLDELLALCDRVMVLHRGRLSAARTTERLDLETLGLLMSGGAEEQRAADAV